MSAEPPPPPKPIGPGNHDRAWNDPPLFSVAVNTTSRPPARRLTSRVGFSLSGGGPNASSSTAPSGSVSLPPAMHESVGDGDKGFLPPPPMFQPPLPPSAFNNINASSDLHPPLQTNENAGPTSGASGQLDNDNDSNTAETDATGIVLPNS